jgi:hypothetical protein
MTLATIIGACQSCGHMIIGTAFVIYAISGRLMVLLSFGAYSKLKEIQRVRI